MRTLLLTSLLASSTAFAQAFTPMPPPPAPLVPATPVATEEGPGSGLQIDLGLLGAGSIFNFTSALFGGGTTTGGGLPTSFLTPQPSLDVGYQWNQNALLVDLDFNAFSGPSFLFSIAPTYRRYLSPLRTGGFSPFAEGSVAFVILAPNVGPSTIGFGLDGGLGGEWLFTKNFALFAKATLGYVHAGVDGENVDGIGLAGTAGLTLHM